ncbi:MAG TPA: right-handed parallel beta-helix repeat-containing protein [Gaiellaceae bacterium]|nr:right-handed parallel beta-helix repeat-containing protein [Gaiellaceae bacterium]
MGSRGKGLPLALAGMAAALVGAPAVSGVPAPLGLERAGSLADKALGWGELCRGPANGRERVFVTPGQRLDRLVKRSRPGTIFCIRRGIHRLRSPLLAKSDQFFIGEPGSILSGAKTITSEFRRSGSYWVASGQVQENPEVNGLCRGGGSACLYANDVFFDSRPLRRVLERGALGPGRFFFDYEADEIWIGSDPAGHRIEAAVARGAFRSWRTGVSRVVVRGLVIEKFANEGQTGAVQARDGWIIDGNEIRLNHGVGVQGGQLIIRNRIHHNGQLGISLYGGTDVLVAANEIAYNNYADYDWFWEAGGAKFTVTTRLIIRGNYVHHNRGAGLATDWDNIDAVYERNRVEDNAGVGIIHEASYDAVIRNNIVLSNGWQMRNGFDGSGVLVNESENVEIVHNVIVDNLHGVGVVASERTNGRFGAHNLRNVVVKDNTIAFTSRIGTTGLASGDPRDYENGNRFIGNRYTYCQPAAFAWRNPAGGYTFLTKRQWIAVGNDTTGSFRRVPRC